MEQTQQDLLYAVSCAINQTPPASEWWRTLDFIKFYELARSQSLLSLISGGLQKFAPNMPVEWSSAYARAVFNEANMDREREGILKYLEEQHIWYMPLKGIVLKSMYPKAGTREMADNDILFDSRYSKQVHDYMVSKGYIVKSYKVGHVDEYLKPPCYNFEMHRGLYSPNNRKLYDYYKTIKNKMIKDTDNQYGYHLSDEDFYVFMVSHAYRHYRDSGTGVRSLLDIYVYNEKKKDTLDYRYIKGELQKIEANDFEEKVRLLAAKVFGNTSEELTDAEQEVIEYCFRAGTYGSIDQKVENRLKERTGTSEITASSKRKYWMKRILDMEWYKENLPLLYRYRILIPFHLIFRAFRGLTHLHTIKREAKEIAAASKNQKI